MGRRNYSILALFVIASLLLLTVHFREGDSGPLHRAQRGSLALVAPLQKLATRAIDPLRDGWYFMLSIGRLRSENQRLSGEVSRLRTELRELEESEEENERLRALVGFQERVNVRTVPARVIGRPISNWQASIVIDKGHADGIRRNMPVVLSDGLMGQVVEVASRAARVLLITDQRSGVSVRLTRTGETGILQGQVDGGLVVKLLSRESRVRKGDAVVTSGLGGVFPAGLEVGRVDNVSMPPYSLYRVVEVKSPVDFSRVEEVLVIVNPPPRNPFGEE